MIAVATGFIHPIVGAVVAGALGFKFRQHRTLLWIIAGIWVFIAVFMMSYSGLGGNHPTVTFGR